MTVNRRAALLMTAALFLHGASHAADTQDQAQIRSVMMHIWDKPQQRLEIDPIVIQEDRAIASWTQADRGGRALLTRVDGKWQITLCAGDGLKDPESIAMTGVAPASARRLASELNKAESTQPAARRALFSTFEGIVRMDSTHGKTSAH